MDPNWGRPLLKLPKTLQETVSKLDSGDERRECGVMSETTRCPRCESASVVHLPGTIGFNQWCCNQCSHQWDFASPEERTLVPKHLTGSRVEQFLEEFLAIKALIKAEAEKIWNSCSNAHQMISVAANDEKRRLFSEQFDRWRDQLIGLQEILIVDRLRPLVAKYQILANEQIWLLRACHEAWSPVTAGYLDWLTVAVLGHPHGVGTGAIPAWAWQLRSAPRDVAPEKKASGHFRGLADTLQRELVEHRKGAIARAFLARKTNESPIVDSRMGRLEPEADHGGVTTQADRSRKLEADAVAHEYCASGDEKARSNSRGADSRGGIERKRSTKSGALLSEYRSELKRSILMQLTRKPNATDLEICRGLDAEGAVELPSSWKVRPGDRLFAEAYSNPHKKRRVEVAISKVRADLRKRGLLERR